MSDCKRAWKLIKNELPPIDSVVFVSNGKDLETAIRRSKVDEDGWFWECPRYIHDLLSEDIYEKEEDDIGDNFKYWMLAVKPPLG